MSFSLVDFLIGWFLMNGLSHYIVSLCGVRFLSLFGYSSKGNLAYGVLQYVAAAVIFQFQYGFGQLFGQSLFLGAFAIFTVYLLTGKVLFRFFQKT